MIFLGTDKADTGLRDLETQVASCGTLSDSENICTYTMNLQQVKVKFSHSPVFLKCVCLVIRADVFTDDVFISAGRSGQPSAVQVRLILVPGGRCNSEWK